MKNKKVIEFESLDEAIDLPTPSRLDIPEWWKEGDLWTNGKISVENYSANPAMKACIPFLEPLRSGYLIKLWTDILVKQNEGFPQISWVSPIDPIEIRDKDKNPTVPIPAGCYDEHMIWKLPFYIKTPKGYSSLITHPFNRHDLPFVSLTGIVDTDNALYPGSYPFFIKKGFEGKISKGTPIAQILPFRRDDWVSQRSINIIQEGELLRKKSQSIFSGYYKKYIWKKKQYE